MELVRGTTLQSGRYLLEEVLGQSGFGITYRATNILLNQPVAIKTLHPSLQSHPHFGQFQQYFLTEAQQLAQCQHPHLAKGLDLFVEAGLAFMVMQYVRGQTLHALVQSEGALPEAIALAYIRQSGNALIRVHQRGLLHRDIKPQNIIRSQGTEFVVVTDFGILREMAPGMVQTQLASSVGYTAPELHRPQGHCTVATDIYGLAATLYFLLTGQTPIAATLRPRLPLMALRYFQPGLSPQVEEAISQGMAMEGCLRPVDGQAWLDLLPIQDVAHIRRSSPLPSPSPHTRVSPMETPIASPQTPQPVSSRRPLPPNSSNPAPSRLTLPILPQIPKSPPGAPRPPMGSQVPPPAVVPSPPSLSGPWLRKALVFTSIAAALLGAAFGLTFRLNVGKGESLKLQPRQSFPDKAWPGSEALTPPSKAPQEQKRP